MYDLEQSIVERHFTRMFLPQPVTRTLVDEALFLAQHAPSNSNIPRWRMVFASGAARNPLNEALLDVGRRDVPNIPGLSEEFHHYRRAGRRGLWVHGDRPR
jgi:nitroreductase